MDIPIVLSLVALTGATMYNTLSIKRMTRVILAGNKSQQYASDKLAYAYKYRDQITKDRCENIAHCFSDRFTADS